MKWICWCALNDLKIEFIGNNLHNVWGQWGIQQSQASKHAYTMCFVVCIDLIVCRRGQLNYLMIDLFIFILLTAHKIIEFAKMSIIIMEKKIQYVLSTPPPPPLFETFCATYPTYFWKIVKSFIVWNAGIPPTVCFLPCASQ